jgi:hypothetical protein
MPEPIAANIRRIRERTAEAALRSGRKPEDIRLMAVTKSVDDQRIREAIAAGVDILGDNYIQEARGKIDRMGKAIPWHFIGHLQTNKAKYAVRLFDMIESVDRLDLAIELDRRSRAEGRVMPVLIEVNIGAEANKSGIPLSGVRELVRRMLSLEGLQIKGLMTMPPWFDDPEQARPYFRTLRELRDRLAEERLPDTAMEVLSMGMTGDFEAAVEEGATIVRVGRGIFGSR